MLPLGVADRLPPGGLNFNKPPRIASCATVSLTEAKQSSFANHLRQGYGGQEATEGKRKEKIMADKPTVKFEVRAQRDPVNNVTIYVPAIVDRSAAKSLATVIENAIDRGLIVGVKPSAANGIATGLCEQLFKEFKDGNAVNFDGYFYGRLYLDGTVNADGRITSENSINIRLVKGAKWALATNDFSFTNIADDKTPNVEFLISACTGAVRGKLIKEQAILVNGSTFGDDAEHVSAKFVFEDGTEVVGSVTSCGENLIAVAWPGAMSGVADGTEVSLTVTRTEGEMEYVSMPKTATIVSAA